jgi:hypothetical protein
MKNKKMIFIVVILIIVGGIYYYFNSLNSVDYTPNAYEIELISYFKEVVLKTEYGNNPNRVLKWKKPMQIYVVEANETQLKAIKKAINQINSLVLNDFRVELVDEQKKCNTILYLSSIDYIKENNNFFYNQFSYVDYEPDGLAYIDWKNYNNELTNAFIYINPFNHIDVQESTILEEITQCIGLPNDSEKYPNSIFYENKSAYNINPTEYLDIDKDVIQLLYHPKIKAGMSTKQVEKEILKILKNKEIKLYGIDTIPNNSP